MPGVWKEIDDAGRSGYCWYCHEWKSSSRVFQIWEGVGIDERDEYEDGICPECGEKLDEDYHCRVCGESDGLLEYTPYGENMPRLYCPWCLVETAYGDFLKKLDPILTHYPGDNDPMCENFQEVEDYVKEVILEIYSMEIKELMQVLQELKAEIEELKADIQELKDFQDYEENTGEIVIYPPDDYH